jgi:uncharacterized protein with PQ loop repeat
MLHHVAKKKRDSYDRLVYFFAVTTPVFEVPQLVQIYAHHSADNVSTITWAWFLLSDCVWLMYGIRHRLRPVIVTYCLYLLVEGAIVVGILMYS